MLQLKSCDHSTTFENFENWNVRDINSQFNAKTAFFHSSIFLTIISLKFGIFDWKVMYKPER